MGTNKRCAIIWSIYLLFLIGDSSALKTKYKTKSKGVQHVSTRIPIKPLSLSLIQTKEPTQSGDNTKSIKNEILISSRILQIVGKKVTVVPTSVGSKSGDSARDIIVGRDVPKSAKVILECSATIPVHWVYKGDRIPEMSTNTTVIRKTEKREDITMYTAAASLGLGRSMKEADTGEYICKSVDVQRTESISYFVYIPGKSLFTSKKGQSLEISREQRSLRIPCTVTHPEAVVTLHKVINGYLQCPEENGIQYNPKSGFIMTISSEKDGPIDQDPSGKYICIGMLNGTYQILEYSVKSALTLPSTNNAPTNSTRNEYKYLYNEDDSDEVKAIQRNEDPCFPHNPCGPNSICKVVPGKSNSPRCSCLSSHIGRPPNCRPECILDIDCPVSMGCRNNQCESVCEDYCGQGAVCRIVDHVAKCMCPPGYTGNAKKFGKCGRIRNPSQHYFPTRPGYPEVEYGNKETSSEEDPNVFQNRFPCSPWPCGPNSECRPVGDNAHCSCSRGYIGKPPHCHPECRKDTDCPGESACIEMKCRDACFHRNIRCGSKAKCMTVNHKPECFCPTGFRGDPLVRCMPPPQEGNQNFPTHNHNSQGQGEFPESPGSISSSEESYPLYPPQISNRPGYPSSPSQGSGSFNKPPQQQPSYPTNPKPSYPGEGSNSNGNNPCRNSPCGKNALCTHRNQTVGCKCPIGMSGLGSNPYLECYPSTNPCEICGPNSECLVKKNRKPICTCLPGKVGSPPNCRDNYCGRNSDCPEDQRCHRGTCEDPCLRANCGENAICKGMRHHPVCACLNAPDKDPFYGCPGIVRASDEEYQDGIEDY